MYPLEEDNPQVTRSCTFDNTKWLASFRLDNCAPLAHSGTRWYTRGLEATPAPQDASGKDDVEVLRVQKKQCRAATTRT